MMDSAEEILAAATAHEEGTLEVYTAKLQELVKPVDELIPLAAQLAATPEWKAFREVLMMNCAATIEKWHMTNTTPTSVEWGHLNGRRSVVTMVEQRIFEAEELRKKSLLSKVEKKDSTMP